MSLTRVSSKGQVVIPQEIREELGIQPGLVLSVFVQGQAIVFKRVEKKSLGKRLFGILKNVDLLEDLRRERQKERRRERQKESRFT